MPATRSPRTASPARRRAIARWIHLAAAALLGTFVYAPAIVADPLRLLLQVVVIPAATLTGVYLWKQAAIRRLLRRPARIPAAD
jgi:hypothetical protein